MSGNRGIHLVCQSETDFTVWSDIGSGSRIQSIWRMIIIVSIPFIPNKNTSDAGSTEEGQFALREPLGQVRDPIA